MIIKDSVPKYSFLTLSICYSAKLFGPEHFKTDMVLHTHIVEITFLREIIRTSLIHI